MSIINITPQDIIRGESSAEYLTDGGFSPNSYGLNLRKKLGQIFFTAQPTDRGGATLTGKIVATANDQNLLGNDKYFLDEENNFYTLNGSTFTKQQADVIGSSDDNFGNQSLGQSDLIQFKLETFATMNYTSNPGEIVRLENSDLTTIDSQWWTVTQGNSSLSASVRHPMEEVEGKLYIADSNEIHTWDGTTSVEDAITLPTEVNITSLRKHPNGINLIAFTGKSEGDYSHTLGHGGRIYIIDTVTNNFIREIETEEQIEGSRNVGGLIYVTYGDKVGYFNGEGVTFLKKLESSTTTYSQSITNIEDILVIRDGLHVLNFGDLGAGKVWWKSFKNATNTQDIDTVSYKGDNKLLVSFDDGSGDGDLQEIDFDDVSTVASNRSKFVSNKYVFGDEVQIKGIDLVHDVSNDAGTSVFSVRTIDTEDTTHTIGVTTYINQSAIKTKINITESVDFFQFDLRPVTDSLAFKLMRIFYD